MKGMEKCIKGKQLVCQVKMVISILRHEEFKNVSEQSNVFGVNIAFC